MGRYVILRHDVSAEHQSGVHWDFMLEWGGVLRTWALSEEPLPGRSIAAEPLPDHRRVYLDYEGPISGNRGAVARWDAGEFELDFESPLLLALTLIGDHLRGKGIIQRAAETSHEWQFTYNPWVF